MDLRDLRILALKWGPDSLRKVQEGKKRKRNILDYQFSYR